MAEEAIKIEIKGLDKILAKFNKFPQKIMQYMNDAGDDAAKKLLETRGLQIYPPKSGANYPPVPYYERGKGLITNKGVAYQSEDLGAKWVVKTQNLKTTIGNSASYAIWVHDDDKQLARLEAVGWKKLFKNAKDKLDEMRKVYQAWVDKLIKDLEL